MGLKIKSIFFAEKKKENTRKEKPIASEERVNLQKISMPTMIIWKKKEYGCRKMRDYKMKI